MFKNAMKETSNLFNNKTVRPIGGILMLLKREQEAEFVRKCFRELFPEDSGDLKKRQERIEQNGLIVSNFAMISAAVSHQRNSRFDLKINRTRK